jgi:hypothetical protein
LKALLIIVFIGLSLPLLGLDKVEKAAIKAIRSEDTGLLQSYLEKHPGANCEFSNGKTGLYYSIIYDADKIAEFLLALGADPGFIIDGNTPLKWAIKYDRARIVRFLIEYGARINEPDEYGNTPLMYAASGNNLEICKILIARGADPMYKNPYRKRASDFALNDNESAVYRYLLFMENEGVLMDSLPTMHDGPYIFWEGNDRVVLTYYEHDKEKQVTRLIEKTISTGITDTVINGIGRDTNSYAIHFDFRPDPCEIKTAGNIFVIGDIHGRYDALVNLLINNKIIDAGKNWTFGNGQLVLLGDVFDRGDLVTETLWFLYGLDVQAVASGGNVNLLLGNHEIMTLTGDHRYLNDKYRYLTRYTGNYYNNLFDQNSLIGRWLRSQNIIVRINDYLFVHAGISPAFAAMDLTCQEVNSGIRTYLDSDYRIRKGSPEEVILGTAGPLWYRGYYNNNNSNNLPEVTQEFVDDYLNSGSLKRMIVGHNEQLTINTSFNGKVISADVAIDESGKSSQGLLIKGDAIFRCFSDGRRERMD